MFSAIAAPGGSAEGSLAGARRAVGLIFAGSVAQDRVFVVRVWSLRSSVAAATVAHSETADAFPCDGLAACAACPGERRQALLASGCS